MFTNKNVLILNEWLYSDEFLQALTLTHQDVMKLNTLTASESYISNH